MYDVAIIGGGVVGGMIARTLASYQLNICILEKAHDVATGASAANSAIVHAGYDAKEGSLKAKLNAKNNAVKTPKRPHSRLLFSRPKASIHSSTPAASFKTSPSPFLSPSRGYTTANTPPKSADSTIFPFFIEKTFEKFYGFSSGEQL